MTTIRAKPGQPDRFTAGGCDWVNVKHRLAIMQRVRVIRFMHRNSVFVVVDSDIHAAPDRQFNASTAPPPPAKLSTIISRIDGPLHAIDQAASYSDDFAGGHALKPELIDVCFKLVLL